MIVNFLSIIILECFAVAITMNIMMTRRRKRSHHVDDDKSKEDFGQLHIVVSNGRPADA